MSFRIFKFLVSLIFLIFALIALPLFSAAGEQKKTKKEVVPNPDGSSSLNITTIKKYIRARKRVVRPMQGETIVVDFNEYTECTKLDPDALQSYGIKEVNIGPNGTQEGEILVWVDNTPCESGPLLQTLPFTGPSFLFIFSSPVSDISIDVGDFQDSDSDEITLTAYADEALTQVLDTDRGFIPQDAPAQCVNLYCSEACIKAIEITTESYYNSDPYPNSVYVDNLKFRLSDASLEIISPLQADDFNLTENYTATSDITFEATLTPSTITAPIEWDLNLEYQTSKGKGGGQDQRAFLTDPMEQHFEVYESMGGQLTIYASSTYNSCEFKADPVIITITGVQIPDSLITERLVKLYHGPTARLMTGLAQVESSYRQFENRTLYNRTDLWPKESYDGGSHIGLMQVETTMERAWDWEINTRYGVNWFQHEKMGMARQVVRDIRAQCREYCRTQGLNCRGPRQLNRVEYENMALVLYGEFAGGLNPNLQYYRAQLNPSTLEWEWVINTQNNPEGVDYANRARANQH